MKLNKDSYDKKMWEIKILDLDSKSYTTSNANENADISSFFNELSLHTMKITLLTLQTNWY